MMLCIPLPLLITSQLPRTRKIILCVLFSLGIFVIMCAVINKYYSFAHPFSPMWEFWYVREASTAALVANMPMCWPLLRRIFNLKAFNGNSSGVQSRSKSGPFSTALSGRIGGKKRGIEERNGEMLVSSQGREGGSVGGEEWWERQDGRGESEEYIVGNSAKDVKLEIWESRQVDVERGSVNALETGVEGRDLRADQVRIYDGVGVAGIGRGEFESKVRIEAGKQ
jgi:hypothetical protein